MQVLPLLVAAAVAHASGVVVASPAALREAKTRLALPAGEPIRVTSSGVQEPRSIPLPGGDAWALLWTEVDAHGRATPWYAILRAGAGVAAVRPTSYEIALERARFDPLVAPPDVSKSPLGWDGEVFLVQFVTQVLFEYRAALETLGATVYDHLVHHTLIVRMTPAVRERVAALECVRWIGPFHPELRSEPGLVEALQAGALPVDQVYDIAVFERGPAHKRLVAERIRALGGEVRALVPDGFRFQARLAPELVVAVSGMPEVASLGRWAPGGADMNLVRLFSGADDLEAQTGFTGQGVRGEIFDLGIDDTHPDLQHDGGVLYHGPGGTSAHGTATAGIVFGDGTSNPQARGLLPTGKIVFGYSAPYLNSGVANRYLETAELIDPALPYQCVFQSSSTGSSRTFFYNAISAEMDDILFHNDIVVVQSQGNSGNPESRPEAWAKNIVSCGGVVHQDTLTPDDDTGGGASTGPATDGRIKPDLAHFYDNILTLGGGGTTIFGGTSASTAIVAGHFGLFFQMWHNEVWGNTAAGATVFESRPSARLARAAMINSARQWDFSGAGHSLGRLAQGWGAPHVGQLYDGRDEAFWVDESDVLDNLAANHYDLPVASGTPALKATLVYRDPKGVAFSAVHRINDLTLRVTAPDGTVYWGNAGLDVGTWSTPGGAADTLDVVENVFVLAPQAGAWQVSVLGSDINTDLYPGVPGNNADYALWVSGVTEPCGAPLVYCTAKPTSGGSTPAIGSSGTPSVATQDFHVTLIGAVPGATSNVFWGQGPAAVPFSGGLLCAAPPITRGPPSTTNAAGADDYPVTVLGSMIGSTRYYQWWFRDPGDPFGVGLSDALEVTFCD